MPKKQRRKYHSSRDTKQKRARATQLKAELTEKVKQKVYSDLLIL